jgi:hypothetical protein
VQTALLCQTSPGSVSSGQQDMDSNNLKATLPQGFGFIAAQADNTANNDEATTNSSIDAISLSLAAKTDNDNRNTVQKFDPTLRDLLMAMFATAALALLLTHRLWPIRFKKLDILFAGDHYIKDSHAKRMLDSRLGTAFTFMLPFFFGMAVVSIFAADNDLEIKGLEPASSVDPPIPSVKSLATNPKAHPGITTEILPKLFKRLVFDIATFAPGTFECTDILVTEPSGAISCQRTDAIVDAGGGGGGDASTATFCRLSLECTVGSTLRGEQDVSISFPSAFQR